MNQFIRSKVEQFLTAFQQIEINIAPSKAHEPIMVTVHAPYMLQTLDIINRPDDFAKLRKRHQDRLLRVKKAREQAPKPVKQFFQSQFYNVDGQEKLLAGGRAELDEIRQLLQKAVQTGLIQTSSGKAQLDGYGLRGWLKMYGIGLDCSAFVQQALTYLVNACRAELGETAVTNHQIDLGFLRCGWVYRDITTGTHNRKNLFTAVSSPSKAKPGDVLLTPGHIRIVIKSEVTENGRFILHLAESISAVDIPYGHTTEEADIGPRQLQIYYPAPHKPLSEQAPQSKRPHDATFQFSHKETSYVLGRFNLLNHYLQSS